MLILMTENQPVCTERPTALTCTLVFYLVVVSTCDVYRFLPVLFTTETLDLISSLTANSYCHVFELLQTRKYQHSCR